MKAYYIFQQADEETISNILDWMRNQERAIYRAAVRELGALKNCAPNSSSANLFRNNFPSSKNAVMETQQ